MGVLASQTYELIERTREAQQGPGWRAHLGASIIGKKCPRQLWYIFRWAFVARFSGRMLRLFDRGNREEDTFAGLMRKAGIHVLTQDPETGKQFRIIDHDGHFGGSLDGLLFDTPEFPGMWVLGEFKTHNDKSFKNLLRKLVKKSKWEHFVQCQIYMRYRELPAALYFAVNKNDDQLHIEVVEPDIEVAEENIDRARKIIFATKPPQRISDSPGWFECKWCDAKDVCHYGKMKAFNCRTCINAQPIDEGDWFCNQFGVVIPLQFQKQGCQHWTEIPE